MRAFEKKRRTNSIGLNILFTSQITITNNLTTHANYIYMSLAISQYCDIAQSQARRLVFWNSFFWRRVRRALAAFLQFFVAVVPAD